MFEPVNYNKLNEVFNKFAGQEVQVTNVEMCGFKTEQVVISPSDKVTAELRSALKELGLSLRLQMPGEMGDFSYNPHRVNVSVAPDYNDNKYHLGRSYKIG